MSPRHRNRILQPTSFLISYLASGTHATFTNDFSAYPVASRPCLDRAAAASGCTGNTVTEMNLCLCGNGGNFVLATATCVAKTVKDELDDVYGMLLTSCTDSRTPLGVSLAQFLGADDDDDDDKSSTSSSQSTTWTTSTATASSTPASTTSYVPMTTYKSVANGVTVTVTRGIEPVPTATNVGKGSSSSSSNPDSGKDTKDNDGPRHSAIAAGLVGGFAFLLALVVSLCYRKRKQRKERATGAGAGGKFAALSSATSLTTMNSPPPQGAPTNYNGANDRRPDTAGAMAMAAGTTQWNQQQQQQQHQNGNLSPQYWQQQNGQPSGTWPSPVASTNGPTGTWGVSPMSQYPPGTSGGSPSTQDGTWNGQPATARDGTWSAQAVTGAASGAWNGQGPAQSGTWNGPGSAQNGTWNAQAVPGAVPYPSNTAQYPVFELPGDHIQVVEADSTPIGPAQPAQAPQQPYQQQYQQHQQTSSSILSTPQLSIVHPAQPAPAHHGMPRQVDDALQISQVELPPPRYTAPPSEWVSEDKKFG